MAIEKTNNISIAKVKRNQEFDFSKLCNSAKKPVFKKITVKKQPKSKATVGAVPTQGKRIPDNIATPKVKYTDRHEQFKPKVAKEKSPKFNATIKEAEAKAKEAITEFNNVFKGLTHINIIEDGGAVKASRGLPRGFKFSYENWSFLQGDQFIARDEINNKQYAFPDVAACLAWLVKNTGQGGGVNPIAAQLNRAKNIAMDPLSEAGHGDMLPHSRQIDTLKATIGKEHTNNLGLNQKNIWSPEDEYSNGQNAQSDNGPEEELALNDVTGNVNFSQAI